MISIDDFLHINSLHDNLLTGLNVMDKSKLMITIFTSDGEAKIGDLLFINTTYCRFNDFLLGNIIFDISIYTNEDFQDMDNDLSFILNVDKSQLNNEWVKSIKNQIASGGLYLIIFSTSYGVYGGVLSKEIQFLKSEISG